MSPNTTHAQYAAKAPEWSRARDVIAGEDAVKAAGTKYLPRLDSQSDEEYAAYRTRASFFGATARTLEEYLDLIFRRAPLIHLGPDDRLKPFAADCDACGLDFARYARRALAEVLALGRAGSLLSWGTNAHPTLSLWHAEEILNWQTDTSGPAPVLTELVLRAPDGLKVLKLEDSACVHEHWTELAGAWVLRHREILRRDGVPLSFIPFVFHGSRHSSPDPDRLPLADIIAANLDHYRLDADYKHGLHFAALPTAWVSGFDRGTPLRIGSSVAWVSDIPGATAGFLEFTGAGLAHLERALDRVERRMTLLGARMLEGNSGATAGATSSGDPPRDLCGLGAVVAAVNESLSHVLRLANWWLHGGHLADTPDQVRFTMNTDLAARAMSGEELSAVVAAWRAGAISRDSMLERLKRGEVLPDGRSIAQERALIHRVAAIAGG